MTKAKYKDRLTQFVHPLVDADISWQLEAACLDTGNEKYFADPNMEREKTAEAKKVCKTCDVRWRCLQFATNNEIMHGIWGGYTSTERKSYMIGRTI